MATTKITTRGQAFPSDFAEDVDRNLWIINTDNGYLRFDFTDCEGEPEDYDWTWGYWIDANGMSRGWAYKNIANDAEYIFKCEAL